VADVTIKVTKQKKKKRKIEHRSEYPLGIPKIVGKKKKKKEVLKKKVHSTTIARHKRRRIKVVKKGM
jgi:hypothetical protein